MSGHSHWSGIKYKKAKVDKQRARVFSRISKQIMSAVRVGGKDPETNLDLKYALEAAKEANVPKENVERAILKASGELEGQRLEAVHYEGYGPGGAAVLVQALTDNRHRTTAHVRKIFDSHGGEMGSHGCVAWLFESKGLILLDLVAHTEEEVFDVAVEAGAEDFQSEGELYELTCEPTKLATVKEALESAGIRWESAEITQVPQTYADLTPDEGRKMLKLMEEMEDDEDVTNVYSNFNLPAELVAELAQEE
ncbi:MAG: YebC/PmpR family DNA-binding transcriptional regulator [Planctomycetes bacterium]|nr:YebC/PmpR family DNA-binding transcriptional regulator [Planctomycetota bacterium]